MTVALACLCALLCVSPALAASAEVESDPWFESGRAAVARARALAPQAGRAKNAILFVGDGMSLATATAARILEGQRRGEPGEENLLAFETLPYVALAKTYNTDQQVPDSAGTMTAMVSGVKTKAGVLGVDDSIAVGDFAGVGGARVATLIEQAEMRGLATGVVTTTRLTHATPAACYAHAGHRDWEDDSRLPPAARDAGFPDIARQLIEFPFGDGLEVALGGGRAQFLPATTADPEEPGVVGRRLDGRDLTKEWQSRRRRAAYVWNLAQFEAVDPATTDHLLGLFEPSHMEWEADRELDRWKEPSLSQMTAKAIDMLSRNPKGFVLMVEGGRIDHGHHANNAYRALGDTIEFSSAVATALARTSSEETLIVVTADHGHVFTIAGYPDRGNDILGLVARADPTGAHASQPAHDALGLPYTTLTYANGPGYPGASDAQPEGPKRFPHFPQTLKGTSEGRPDLSGVNTGDPHYLQEAAVPMRAETHSGEDVPIYAGGPGAALFHGVQEQHFVYHAIVEALGWSAPEAPSTSSAD